jgi:hypothetical protein
MYTPSPSSQQLQLKSTWKPLSARKAWKCRYIFKVGYMLPLTNSGFVNKEEEKIEVQ